VVARVGEEDEFVNTDDLLPLVQSLQKQLSKLIESKIFDFDADNLPTHGGVYRIIEKANDSVQTIYVGQSISLRKRIYRNHLMGSRRTSTLKNKLIKSGRFLNENEVKNHLREYCAVQFVVIEDESERLSFEHFAIAVLQPPIND